jgi:ATP-binding cassette, subfamily F, member 3
MGQLQPLSGGITLGASLKVGYFAQAHDGLNPDDSVIEALLRHKEMPLSAARNHLAQYLFRGDDVFKKVGMLSGGERGKLALAVLALEGANLLLLDEPTNHLDINAQEVLQEVLENFEGTILMVTHDRYLVDKLATQIWDLREGYLHVFRGSYQEYLAARVTARQQAKDQPKPSKAMPAHTPNTSTAQVRKQTQLVERVEQQIAQVESALARIERALTKASEQGDKDKIQQLSREHAATQAELNQLLEQWTEVAS